MPRRLAALTQDELAILRKLSTPIKIQDYLDSLPINFEKCGETCYSPRRVLREQKAHCIEGALLAATALMLAGEKPLVLDLKTLPSDDEHVVALYRRNGLWGAISKTNHATVRFRDPIYKNVRELALSYFHEYFLDTTGVKTLRSHSSPINLNRFGTEWITAEEDLWNIANALDEYPHYPLFPESNTRYLRKADDMERKAGSLHEWTVRDKGT
ncbi:MAG: hypothetical protein P4M11_00800 [Candidatus Pacebacteria bacterium]|nr:hypothetical protein [Candidatus Paceibacterota bacterium]